MLLACVYNPWGKRVSSMCAARQRERGGREDHDQLCRTGATQ